MLSQAKEQSPEDTTRGSDMSDFELNSQNTVRLEIPLKPQWLVPPASLVVRPVNRDLEAQDTGDTTVSDGVTVSTSPISAAGIVLKEKEVPRGPVAGMLPS